MRRPETPDLSYLELVPRAPVWQFPAGWLVNDDYAKFRWTRPHAVARLLRPAGAKEFELRAQVSELYINTLHSSHVEVAVNGKKVGAADFDRAGIQTVRWKLENAPAGEAEVTIDTSPVFPGETPLGIAVAGLGFVSGEGRNSATNDRR